MKKLISIMIAVVMLLAMVPAVVQAEGNGVSVLYVGSVNALETPRGDGWRYDAETGVLTLENCTVTDSSAHRNQYDETEDALIYFQGDLIIELIGENSVERVISEAPAESTYYSAICAALYPLDDYDESSTLSIRGSGSLTAGIAFPEEAVEWDFYGWHSGIKCSAMGGVDLTGLQNGGKVEVYGGILNYPGYYRIKAFNNSPTWGDDAIVVAYRDVEGTQENEFGYNWNNNDAWRLLVTTESTRLDANGKLTVNGSAAAFGEGWTWENNLLTLDEETPIKALSFGRGVGSAKLVLAGDVALDSSEMNSVPVIYSRSDLEIDTADYTLILNGEYEAIVVSCADLTLSGGSVLLQSMNENAIYVGGGALTVRDTAVEAIGGAFCTDEAYDEANDYEWIPGGSITVEDAQLTAGGLQSAADITVTNSSVSVATLSGTAISARKDVVLSGSTVTVAAGESGYGVYADKSITVDRCTLDISAGQLALSVWGMGGEATDCLTLENMNVLQPTDYTIGMELDDYGYEYATVLDGEGNGAKTLKTGLAAAEREDLDGDGVTDTADVLVALQYLNGSGTEDLSMRADFNNDGRVSLADALHLLKLLNK